MAYDKVNVIKKNNVKFLTFPILDETGLVLNAFSTREGGVSKGIYSTMNLSLRLDDNKEDVLQNIELFCNAVGINKDKIVMSNQTHSDKLKCVDENDFGTGITKPFFNEDVDGLITNVKGLTLMTFYADCVPVFFLDKKKKVIAISHSGWKGTYSEIAKATVETMIEKYDSNPVDIIAVTGPSICKKCYEVSVELGKKFLDKFHEASACIDFINDKCYLDLSGIIKHSLLSVGLKDENIVLSKVCTCCNGDVFHSHRASGGKRGLNAAVLCLR